LRFASAFGIRLRPDDPLRSPAFAGVPVQAWGKAMEPLTGIEPVTFSLPWRCSTS
jgi:hypothetical protein